MYYFGRDIYLECVPTYFTVSYHKCKVLLSLAHCIKNTIIGVIHDQMLIDKKKIKLLYVGGFGERKC